MLEALLCPFHAERRMTSAVELKCACGKVRGQLRLDSRKNGVRIVCQCRDCQTFAHFLGRADLIDPYGGVDIFQTTPERMSIAEGRELIQCMRLSDKGMMRFYAGCCRTPIANTMASAKLPFVGLSDAFMNHAPRTRDQDLGPVASRVNVANAKALPPEESARANALLPILRTFRIMLGAWFMGRRSSPFFDQTTGLPVAAPTILTPGERERLRRLAK